MTNPFTSGFMTTLGRMIAFSVFIAFVLILVFIGFKTYDKYHGTTPSSNSNNNVVINKPEYKPSKAVSTANKNEMKVNHEKLDKFISNNDAIIADYYKK